MHPSLHAQKANHLAAPEPQILAGVTLRSYSAALRYSSLLDLLSVYLSRIYELTLFVESLTSLREPWSLPSKSRPNIFYHEAASRKLLMYCITSQISSETLFRVVERARTLTRFNQSYNAATVDCRNPPVSFRP